MVNIYIWRNGNYEFYGRVKPANFGKATSLLSAQGIEWDWSGW